MFECNKIAWNQMITLCHTLHLSVAAHKMTKIGGIISSIHIFHWFTYTPSRFQRSTTKLSSANQLNTTNIHMNKKYFKGNKVNK